MAAPIIPTANPIIPKLELHLLRDDQLDEFAQEKIDKIKLAPAFDTVVPKPSEVDDKNKEWRNALVKADDGSKADTALKDRVRKELEALLTLQAQNCAEIANGDLPLYLTTGYEAKDTQGAPTGELPAVIGLELFYGDSDGDLKASWNPLEDAENFSVQAFADVANPDTSLLKEYIIGKIGKQKATLTGLPSGQKIFVRVRANGGSTGHGAWSDIAEKRVP